MADERLRIVIDALNKASDDLVKVKKELGGLDDTTKEADTSTKSFGETWAGVLTGINSGIMIARQGAAALKRIYDTAREGAALEYAETKFERLAASIGTTADALMGDLRDATRGMYSDAELMANAGDMMALGLANTHDEAVRLAKVAAALNMNMNQLTLTLTNKTTMRFDALGVSVDGFDERLQALIDTGMDADEAFGEAFLQQAEEQIEKVGEAADTSMGDFMQFEAAIKNATDSMKKHATQSELVKGVLTEVTEVLTTATDYTDTLDEALANNIITQEDYVHIQGQVHKGYMSIDEAIAFVNEATEEYRNQQGITNPVIDDTITHFGDLSTAINGTESSIGSLNAGLQNASEGMASYNEKLLFTMASQNMTEGEALALAESMGLVDERTRTAKNKISEYGQMLDDGQISVKEYNLLVAGLADQLDRITNKSAHVSITSSVSGPAFSGGFSGGGGGGGGANIKMNASGGPVSAGNPYLWQEYGYRGEMMVPSQDGFVLSRADAKRILSEAVNAGGGGGGPTYTYNLTANYPQQSPLTLMQQIKLLEASHV
jgi:hypothetical protein